MESEAEVESGAVVESEAEVESGAVLILFGGGEGVVVAWWSRMQPSHHLMPKKG